MPSEDSTSHRRQLLHRMMWVNVAAKLSSTSRTRPFRHSRLMIVEGHGNSLMRNTVTVLCLAIPVLLLHVSCSILRCCARSCKAITLFNELGHLISEGHLQQDQPIWTTMTVTGTIRQTKHWQHGALMSNTNSNWENFDSVQYMVAQHWWPSMHHSFVWLRNSKVSRLVTKSGKGRPVDVDKAILKLFEERMGNDPIVRPSNGLCA